MRLAHPAVVATLVLAVACGGEGRTRIGPLSIEVPEGWQVTRRSSTSLQIADGTAGGEDATRPGTATAVFDIFLDAPVTVGEYRESLLEQNVGARTEDLTIDGQQAVLLAYQGSAVAGKQEAVFFPGWGIQIVYRAAFPNHDAAFDAGRSAFRGAIRSIELSSDEIPDDEAA